MTRSDSIITVLHFALETAHSWDLTFQRLEIDIRTPILGISIRYLDVGCRIVAKGCVFTDGPRAIRMVGEGFRRDLSLREDKICEFGSNR